MAQRARRKANSLSGLLTWCRANGPAPSEASYRFPPGPSHSLQQFICQKKRVNGKNPAFAPRAVLQVSKIFERWPSTPLGIVFTLLARQHPIPKHLITVLEVELHLGDSRSFCHRDHAHFSAQMVYLHMDNWPKDKYTLLPFSKSWSPLSCSRTDFPDSFLPFPS